MKKLLTPFKKGKPFAQKSPGDGSYDPSRAIDNLPNDLMAEYYGQRSGAGLIITEGHRTNTGSTGLSQNSRHLQQSTGGRMEKSYIYSSQGWQQDLFAINAHRAYWS
jgi:hypothetical protein